MDLVPTEMRSAVRAPKQARTRESWQRILDIGLELLEEGGTEALSISEVCRRGAVSPPSLYARVDGRAGLFTAVWEHGMTRVHATEAILLARERSDGSADEQARAAARILAGVFTAHARFLRPVIAAASTDATLRSGGSAESRSFLTALVTSMPRCAERAYDIARTLYAECVLHTLYGADFLAEAGESDAEFEERLERIASWMATAA